MSSRHPTPEGFRILFRRPAIPLTEIAWRWSFGAAVWFLGGSFILEYADTLQVTTLDRLLLATQQPVLIAQAIHRIFEGSAFRFTRAGLLLGLALTMAWILLASLGRLVTTRSLIAEANAGTEPESGGGGALIALSFLQVANTLAAVIAAIGSALLASSVWASTHGSAGDAMRLWLAVLCLTAVAWSTVNWFLSTSAIFAVEKSRGALDAFASLVRLCAERPIAMAAPGVWFGLIHFGAWLFACGAAFTVLATADAIGARGVLLLEFLILVAYSAVASFLRIGRLAAYVSIVYEPADAASVETRGPVAPKSDSGTIDVSELILSDVPLSAS